MKYQGTLTSITLIKTLPRPGPRVDVPVIQRGQVQQRYQQQQCFTTTPFMRYQGMITAETLAVEIFTIISLINHNARTFAPYKTERLSTHIKNSHSDTHCNAKGDYVSLYIYNCYCNIINTSKYNIFNEIYKYNVYDSYEYSNINKIIQCHAHSYNDPGLSKIQYCPHPPFPNLIYHL